MSNEFIEVISPQAKQQIADIIVQVDLLASKIKSIPNFQLANTPSGADNNIKQLTNDLNQQAKSLDTVAASLGKVNEQKQKSATLTTQQKVDNAIILKQEKQQATLTSEYAKAYEKLNMQRTIARQKLQDLISGEQVENKLIYEKTAKLNELNKKYSENATAIRKSADWLKNTAGDTNVSTTKWDKEFRDKEKLIKTNQQLLISMQKTKQEISQLPSTVSASNAEIRKAQKEFDVLNKKVAAADKAVGKFSEANSKINGLSRSVGNLMTAFGVSTGLYLFASIAKDIYSVTKQLQSLDLALKMVSGSQQEFANNQSFLTNLAEQYGIEIKGLTKNFTEFWVASKGKLEAEQIKAIFTSISKSVAVMGLSVEQQDSAFLALQQMMSKGTVQAEELKKQLGNALPGAVKAATMAYQALHPEMKVTEKYFMEQMKAGKVLSAELLPELAKAYEKLYGIENVKRAETLQAAQERLANSWTDLVRSMNESPTSGISKFFTFVIDLATRTMTAISRLNSSWDELYKKAGERGKSQGNIAFQERMNNAGFATTSEIDKAKMVREYALKELKELQKQEIEINKQIAAFNPYAINLGKSGKDLKLEKEQILLDIAARAEIIKLANTDLLPKTEKTGTAGAKETEAQRKKREAAELKTEKDRIKSIEDLAKTEYELKISNLEVQKQLAQEEIDLANTITQNKEIQYQDVIDATRYYNGVLLAIEKAKYDEEVRLAKDNSKEKEIAYNKWFISTLKLSKEMAESLLKVTKDFAKEGNDVAKKMLSDFEENAKAFEDIDKKMQGAQADKAKERLESQRRTFNEFMGGFADKSGFGDTFDLLGQKDPETGKTIMQDLLDTDDKGEKNKAYFLAITTVAQDAMNAIDQADEERYQRRLARLDKEKEIALKFAGDSVAAKEKIEEQFEKKRKALEVKEWKRKQKMAIANIAIDTAQAAMASWAKTGFPWAAAAAIAMGAIQAGIVASQKMPEYWKGTDNAEAGLAYTQERGAEIILDKHNRVKSFGSDGGAQLTMMEKGDKVKTASETKKLMFDNGLNAILSDNGIKQAKIEIVNKGLTVDEMRGVMLETLGEQAHYHTNISNGEITNMMIKNGNRTIRNTNRGSGIGFKV